ncbi:MAG: SPOR domain-containing protein [Dysgonamonadaceae bacterium]|jgi:hypothetical protein|nr:SPOR domain-containing protein [Dysgonamonadaceae bacterium]
MSLRTFILSSFLCLSGISVQAQGVSDQKNTIIQELQSNDPQNFKGIVRITADPGINRLIGTPWKNSSSKDAEYLKVPGFRVQVFSGNDSRTAKEEASGKDRTIRELFPDVKTYIEYRPPRWSLRIGDFRTKEEAMVFMQELKQAFPDFGKEMYPVKVEEVNIPVNNQN